MQVKYYECGLAGQVMHNCLSSDKIRDGKEEVSTFEFEKSRLTLLYLLS